MNKLILKTALISIAGFVLTALLVFSLWILISPQTMATSCEKTGNYSFAVTCADLRYKYTNDVSDLARCAEDSILSGKDNLIVRYGEQLVSDNDYSSLCAQKDEAMFGSGFGQYTLNYNAFIGGNLASAQYRTGDFDKAVETAEKCGNFTGLIIEIIESGTKTQAQKVLETLNGSDENLAKLLDEFISD